MPANSLRLYRDDSYLTRFTAQVLQAGAPREGIVELLLDRTAFYPTGGGQPHDTGLLAGHAVIDVREAGDGTILHLVRADAAPQGQVDAEVDWRRRFDHMQQHSGQHILSRAFVEVAGAATRSFHLGEASCTIDLDLSEPGDAAVRRAEARANDIIFGDSPVVVEQVDPSRAPDLAADMNLVRELALKPGDPIRIIKIGSFDETPCGGTHVRRSGEVGALAIRSWEKFKGGARVSFFCGGRVVRAIGEMAAVVDACVARLSAQPPELPAAIARLQEQLTESRRAMKGMHEELLATEALSKDASARVVGACRVLVESFAQRDAADLQPLARAYVAAGSRVALLAARGPAGGKSTLLFARSEDGPSGLVGMLDMGRILSEVCRAHGGKGGGASSMARGGGVLASETDVCLEEAFHAIRSQLPA